MRQIIDAVYITVEEECDGCNDQLLMWVTSHMRGTSVKEWWPKPAVRKDGFSVLAKKDDEAYMLIFREEDGRVGTVLWPTEPFWTKEQLWESIEIRKKQILDETLPATIQDKESLL